MKLSELVERYCFHDSYLKSVHFDSFKKSLTISIHFCNWMQSYYQASMEKLILINLIFSNIKYFECDSPEKYDWRYTIFDMTSTSDPSYGDGIKIVMFHDDTGEMSLIHIFAQDVEFVDLGVDED